MDAPPSRLTIWTIGLYSTLVLIFTGLSIAFGGPKVDVGVVRPADTIPIHLAELAGFGLILGLGALVLYGSKGSWFLLLTPALVILLDLDHLPIYLGTPQPVRPAHSLVFLVVALTVTAVILRRMEIELILASSFMGHMGVDTGIFPPFSPFIFNYVQLQEYRVPLLVASVILALAAGFSVRRGLK